MARVLTMAIDQSLWSVVFWVDCKGRDGGVRHEQEKEQQERGREQKRGRERREGGKERWRGVNGGKYRKRERERKRVSEMEMMAVIRIKTVGFGQSRDRAAASVPTPHPRPVPSSSPNQPLWHMQGASMTHKQTAHGATGNIPNTLNRQQILILYGVSDLPQWFHWKWGCRWWMSACSGVVYR